MTTEQKILEKLERIEKDVNEIKKHMIDEDIILTKDDLKSLREAEEDLKKGKTKRIA